MNTPQIIFLYSKDDVKRIKFLIAGTSNDVGRPVLQYIYLDKARNLAVAADGFRLHVCNLPESLHEHAGKLIKFLSRPKYGYNMVEIREEDDTPAMGLRFPDFWPVYEQHTQGKKYYSVNTTHDVFGKSYAAFPGGSGEYGVRWVIGKPDDPYLLQSDSQRNEFWDCKAIISARHGTDHSPLTELGEILEKHEAEKKLRIKLEAADFQKRVDALKEAQREGRLTEEMLSDLEAVKEKFSDFKRAVINLENRYADHLKALRDDPKE